MRHDTTAAAVAFEGIAVSSLQRPDFTLYEFQTQAGVWVRLHDMRFLGLQYDAQSSTLTMQFLYDDTQWTPPEASDTPLAVFQFRAVQVRHWEDDGDPLETPSAARGQVDELSYDEATGDFTLGTVDTTLRFSARRLAVHLGPRPAG